METITGRRMQDAITAETTLALQLPKDVFTQLCIKKLHPYVGMMTWQFNPKDGEYMVTDKLARRVDMLLGPHAYAMFRAWAINQLEATNE